MHIRTRNDLIKFLEENAPRRAIARALQEGQVENLGAFQPIPPSPFSGWIVKVTSKFNKTWYIAVHVYYHSCIPTTRIIDVVPWEKWIGHKSKNKLYMGDKPLQYKELQSGRQKRQT